MLLILSQRVHFLLLAIISFHHLSMMFRQPVDFPSIIAFILMASLLPCNLGMSNNDASSTSVYKRRKPEDTILYQTVLHHLDEYIVEAGDVPAYIENTFRKYLTCGILAYGFARARCSDCGLSFLLAFSCKQRGACPSCNAKYMVMTSAHIVDNVLPRVKYRQWVLSRWSHRCCIIRTEIWSLH